MTKGCLSVWMVLSNDYKLDKLSKYRVPSRFKVLVARKDLV